MKRLLLPLSLIAALACSTATTYDPQRMNAISERYVKLVLSLGEHDTDYVDAYYGPPEWRDAVKASKPSLDEIRAGAVAVIDELRAMPSPSDEMNALRHKYLQRQTEALLARVDILRGKKLTFDQESQALYDAVAPHHDEAYFQKLTEELGRELPGDGSLIERLESYRKNFVIPKEKLDPVFKAAIEGCRARTLEHIKLPPGETFTVEYVTNKSWSGYNWFKGNYNSLIQVNTDLPIFIDRAIDLACHEGYPGHHVYNTLLEKNLVDDRGWKELTVYPLFSPQSLIAEGSANYGIDVAFPAEERVAFEKTNLFPIAGIAPTQADRYYRIQELTAKLSYAGNEAARRYLDGEINAQQAAEWLTKYALMSPPRAQQRVKFIDQYRSYVINYNLGKDLVKAYVERHAGNDREKRWQVFQELLSTPRLPTDLAK
ncbi:MAG: hypothetical protein QOI24_2445 [Acidobacteriota bacterium]|jgi:hypothetical protein|nr:hypothetical protein [Acidobacteriota bacterium]